MLSRATIGPLTLSVDGRAVAARDGDSVATAMLAAGIMVTRHSAISGAPRGPWCLMGACFECVVTVDGHPNQRACMTPAHDGTQIETHGH